jgi:hypothetical protein
MAKDRLSVSKKHIDHYQMPKKLNKNLLISLDFSPDN